MLFSYCKLTFICLITLIIYNVSVSGEKYTNRYDNVDIDEILDNRRVLTNYIKCLMEEGPCTPEGRELKKTLPDALATGCTKCNDNQKEVAEKVIRFLMKNRTKDWERLTNKYDPNGAYKKRYEQRVGPLFS